MTPEIARKLKLYGMRFLGMNYDNYFEWSGEKLYCSELVWKIYKNMLNIELGKLELLSDFNIKHPVVREKLKERFGDDIPVNEQVISPVAIFNSEQLDTVFRN